MSDSVTLRKTYGIVYVILSFVSLALGLSSFWGVFHFSSDFSVFLLFPFTIFATLFIFSCSSAYEHFVAAGKYLEKEERRKKREHPMAKEEDENEDMDTEKKDEEEEEETEESRDFTTLQDSAQLRKTYGILSFIGAFILFAAVILSSLILFPKDPVFLLLLPVDAFIGLFIFALTDQACTYFMEVGMYLEKGKRIMEN